MTNRLKRPKWNMYPVPVESPEGKLCTISTCIKDVKWKILDSFFCQDHITHPKQEKFPFIEGLKNGEANQVEREGKEVAGGVSGSGNGGDNRGPGEGLLRERGSSEQQAGELVGAQLVAETGGSQVGKTGGPGSVLLGEAVAVEYVEETPEFGSEEDDILDR